MSVPGPGPAKVSTVIMRHRILTGLAVASLSALAALTAGHAEAATGVPAPTLSGGGFLPADRQPVAVDMAADVSEPSRQAADSEALLAGAMVLGACAAFAGTGMVRRRKIRR